MSEEAERAKAWDMVDARCLSWARTANEHGIRSKPERAAASEADSAVMTAIALGPRPKKAGQ